MASRKRQIQKIAERKYSAQNPPPPRTGNPAPSAKTAPPVDPRYRPDIDGLRAVAILSVLVFHFFPAALPGGFIGVDVFFVISGYLISGILREQLEADRFSLTGFYSRRITRLFPALFLVFAACFMYGWFALLPTEFKQLGKQIAGGAGFISNFLFLNESGYFAGGSDTKPLLHLWSLSIEEQYYLVWPLLLWFAYRRGWSLLGLVLVLMAISFGLNIWTVSTSPSAAFYLPQTRAWELLAGAALACLRPRDTQEQGSLLSRFFGAEVRSVLGSLLIVAGLFFIAADRKFPGWWALMPVVGTVLLISAGSTAWINRRVLAARGMVAVGLISYPLYLWHWPLLAFLKIHSVGKPSVGLLLAVLFLSFILAWLTYRLIETPFRSGQSHKGRALPLLVLMLVTGILGLQGYRSNGFEGLAGRSDGRAEWAKYFENSPPEYAFYKKAGLHDLMRDDCNFSQNTPRYQTGPDTTIPRKAINESCYKRDGRRHAVFLWGDSHAQHLNPGLRDYLPKQWQLLQVTTSSCLPRASDRLPNSMDECSHSNWFAVDKIRETKPDVVIVAQRWGHDVEQMKLITAELSARGVKKVVFVGPAPEWDDDLWKIIVQKFWVNTPVRIFEGLKARVPTANTALKQAFKPSGSMVLVDLFDVFCNLEGCMTRIGDDPKAGITSTDSNHLSKVASDYLARTVLVEVVTGSRPEKP